MEFTEKYSWKIHSQNGEEGILEEILRRIDKSVGISVEFGAPNETYCSNTYFLKERGWVTHFFDSNPESPNVTKKLITTENINELPLCTVLSIDTDGCDYELWARYTHKPDVVIIEIDSSLDPEDILQNDDGGVNFRQMLLLGQSKGYFLVAHTGNMIFVLNKYERFFEDIYYVKDIDKFNRSWIK